MRNLIVKKDTDKLIYKTEADLYWKQTYGYWRGDMGGEV